MTKKTDQKTDKEKLTRKNWPSEAPNLVACLGGAPARAGVGDVTTDEDGAGDLGREGGTSGARCREGCCQAC